MSWAIGYDEKWKRDIGYGVPAYCDFPGCMTEIDRGLAHVCGGEPYGGEDGCGLYFCAEHHSFGTNGNLCIRCENQSSPFQPSREHPDWIRHKLTDESWQEWREANPEEVSGLSKICETNGAGNKLHCLRCGHTWIQRQDKLPQRCAAKTCRSPYWQTVKKTKPSKMKVKP